MENKFNISNGNLKVLETIPKMMLIPKWRKKIRLLVMDYLFKNIKKAERKDE